MIAKPVVWADEEEGAIHADTSRMVVGHIYTVYLGKDKYCFVLVRPTQRQEVVDVLAEEVEEP